MNALDGIYRTIGAARMAAAAEGFESTGDRRRMRRDGRTIEIVEMRGWYSWGVAP